MASRKEMHLSNKNQRKNSSMKSLKDKKIQQIQKERYFLKKQKDCDQNETNRKGRIPQFQINDSDLKNSEFWESVKQIETDEPFKKVEILLNGKKTELKNQTILRALVTGKKSSKSILSKTGSSHSIEVLNCIEGEKDIVLVENKKSTGGSSTDQDAQNAKQSVKEQKGNDKVGRKNEQIRNDEERGPKVIEEEGLLGSQRSIKQQIQLMKTGSQMQNFEDSIEIGDSSLGQTLRSSILAHYKLNGNNSLEMLPVLKKRNSSNSSNCPKQYSNRNISESLQGNKSAVRCKQISRSQKNHVYESKDETDYLEYLDKISEKSIEETMCRNGNSKRQKQSNIRESKNRVNSNCNFLAPPIPEQRVMYYSRTKNLTSLQQKPTQKNIFEQHYVSQRQNSAQPQYVYDYFPINSNNRRDPTLQMDKVSQLKQEIMAYMNEILEQRKEKKLMTSNKVEYSNKKVIKAKIRDFEWFMWKEREMFKNHTKEAQLRMQREFSQLKDVRY